MRTRTFKKDFKFTVVIEHKGDDLYEEIVLDKMMRQAYEHAHEAVKGSVAKEAMSFRLCKLDSLDRISNIEVKEK